MIILKWCYTNLFWPVLFLLMLIPMLVGCDSAVSGTTTSNTPTPKLDSSPKGSGAANLTATARATPVSTVCPTISAKPASTTRIRPLRSSSPCLLGGGQARSTMAGTTTLPRFSRRAVQPHLV